LYPDLFCYRKKNVLALEIYLLAYVQGERFNLLITTIFFFFDRNYGRSIEDQPELPLMQETLQSLAGYKSPKARGGEEKQKPERTRRRNLHIQNERNPKV